MFRFPKHSRALAGLVAAGLAACSPGSKTPEGTSNSVQIVGAGSSFVYPVMTRWISEFQQRNPGVQANYQSIGSGGGIQQLKGGRERGRNAPEGGNSARHSIEISTRGFQFTYRVSTPYILDHNA
jgi:PBP superfamily domain